MNTGEFSISREDGSKKVVRVLPSVSVDEMFAEDIEKATRYDALSHVILVEHKNRFDTDETDVMAALKKLINR